QDRSRLIVMVGRLQIKVGRGDFGPFGQHQRLFDVVFELTNVAGPGKAQDCASRAWIEAVRRIEVAAVLFGVTADQIARYRQRIVTSFAQGGELDADDVEAEV